MKRLLIVRPDGIGDFIIFSGVLEEYARQYPDYQIDLLCDYVVKDLVEAIPFIHKKIYIHGKRTLNIANLFAAISVIPLQYDLLIYPVYSRTRVGDFFSTWIRAREKVVFDGDSSRDPQGKRFGRNKYFSRIIEGEKGCKAEFDRNVEFLSKLGAKILAQGVHPRIWFLDSDEERAFRIQKEHGLERGQYLAIFPGAGLPIKCWPVEKWVCLLEMFSKNCPAIRIVILGSGNDKRIVDGIICELHTRGISALNLYAQTPLRVMAKLIADAKLLVSTDTVAVHMAAAIGIPNVCIMGGGHFGRFYPYGDLQKNRIVFNKMDCFGCNWNCIYPQPYCITKIDPEGVWEEVKSLF